MNSNRVNELVTSMKAFGQEKYYKGELLTEMFALQREMIGLTFSDEHAASADLRIWDVEQHLEQLNKDCGNIADEELKQFRAKSKQFSNLVSAEYSGCRGEDKAFRALEDIHTPKRILRNIELSDGDHRTEIDALVITPAAITIVEVKNTAKDVSIDRYGNYYHQGEYQRWKGNIVEKMAFKKRLIEQALRSADIYGLPIHTIVVFTNRGIEVHSKAPSLRTCFLSELSDIIDDYRGEERMTADEMADIEQLISMADHKEAYAFDFDVAQYKRDFATVMAILEEASAMKNEPEDATAGQLGSAEVHLDNEEPQQATTEEQSKQAAPDKHNDSIWDTWRYAFTSKAAGYMETAATVVTVGAAAATVTLIAINAAKKGGFLG